MNAEKSLYNILFTGMLKTFAIISFVIGSCFVLGLTFHHFDIQPSFLSFYTVEFSELISEQPLLGILFTGLVSMPSVLIFLMLLLLAFSVITWLILDLGGYHE